MVLKALDNKVLIRVQMPNVIAKQVNDYNADSYTGKQW